MADAPTGFYLGQRSSSQDHRDVLRLVDSVRFQRGELNRNRRHLSDPLATKTAAEHEDRLPSEYDAIGALEHCRRFCRWGWGKLPR